MGSPLLSDCAPPTHSYSSSSSTTTQANRNSVIDVKMWLSTSARIVVCCSVGAAMQKSTMAGVLPNTAGSHTQTLTALIIWLQTKLKRNKSTARNINNLIKLFASVGCSCVGSVSKFTRKSAPKLGKLDH